MSEADLIRVLDQGLAALGDAGTIAHTGPVDEPVGIEALLRLRNEIAPRTLEGIKAKILFELEDHVRRYDMISDELWDQEEPILQVYERCSQIIARTPKSFQDISELVLDVLHELELD